MSVGTFVVSAVLVLIVAAIIASMVKKARRGQHIGCDNCGGCDGIHHEASQHGVHQGHHGGSCSCADKMVAQMEQQLAESKSCSCSHHHS